MIPKIETDPVEIRTHLPTPVGTILANLKLPARAVILAKDTMHELSIAESILSIVRQYVSPDEEVRVRAIGIKVGESSGVVADSLEFSFSAITAETPLHHARLQIEHIPFTLFCTPCGEVRPGSGGAAVCPVCGGVDTKVLGGTELQVVDIELDD